MYASQLIMRYLKCHTPLGVDTKDHLRKNLIQTHLSLDRLKKTTLKAFKTNEENHSISLEYPF